MKKLRFKFRTVDEIDGVERESFVTLSVPDDEAGRRYAETYAYNGIIEEYDDGEPEPTVPAEENVVWDELDTAYQEGVDSV